MQSTNVDNKVMAMRSPIGHLAGVLRLCGLTYEVAP